MAGPFFLPPIQVPDTNKSSFALRAIVDFLMNANATHPGPGWTLVEACDGSMRGGPEGTEGGVSLQELASGNLWKEGGDLPYGSSNGSWIVLESGLSVHATKFQVYFFLYGEDYIYTALIPFADFTTGGSVGLPSFPATVVGSGGSASPDSMFYQPNISQLFLVADETMLFTGSVSDRSIVPNMSYVGEVIGGDPSDTHPFLIWDDDKVPRFGCQAGSTNYGRMSRISPVDNTTRLTNLGSNRSGTTYASGTRGASIVLEPILMSYNGSGHSHFAGMLKNLWSAPASVGFCGTLNNRQYGFVGAGSGGYSSIAFKWDGSSRLPGDG